MKTLLTVIAALLFWGQAKAIDYDMDAQTWCRSVVMGWNLGNSLESCSGNWDYDRYDWINVGETDYNKWETAWGNPVTTREMIIKVCDAGFNAVRIPVRWVPHANIETMEIDSRWMARVKELIDWCLAEDLMVIVNTHHDLWLEHYPIYSRKDELNVKLAKLWSNIATALESYDGRVAFSGTNEVNTRGDWSATPTQENYDVQNSFNQTFVDAVRSTGGNNLKRNLIVQTYRCNPSLGIEHFTVPVDPTPARLSVEYHYYDPYSYCSGHDGSYYYWGAAFAESGKITPDGNERSLAAFFKQIRKTWWEQGLGVVMGEYGWSQHLTADDIVTQQQNVTYYMKCLVGEARKNGFATFLWDNNSFGNGAERFGLFKRSEGMAVGVPYVLEGIKEGAKVEYVETVDYDEQDPDVGVGGKVVWEGEQDLNWGNGLQLRIEASEWKPFNESATLVLYYRQDPSASYQDIQLCDLATWGSVGFEVEGTSFTGDFNPSGFYGTSSASHITPFTFDSTVLDKFKRNGCVVHGYGVTLTKAVLIARPYTSVTSVFSQREDGCIYNLCGVKVNACCKDNVYITNGKKVVKSSMR